MVKSGCQPLFGKRLRSESRFIHANLGYLETTNNAMINYANMKKAVVLPLEANRRMWRGWKVHLQGTQDGGVID